MAVWGCKFDIFGGGGGRGVRIFQIWGGLSFLGLSFPDLLGGGEFLGLSFPDLGVLRSEFLNQPCMDCIARQKHKSALEGSCSGIIDYDVELH